MLRRTTWLLILVTTSLSASTLFYPYAEIRGRGGDYRQGGQLYGFVPFLQNDSSLVFAQGSGGQMRHQQTASLGGGYRHTIGCDGFVGLAGFCDWSYSRHHHSYWQGTISGEAIYGCAELRGNVYLAQNRTQFISESIDNHLSIDETAVVNDPILNTELELSYPGFDVEGGINKELGCNKRVRGYAAYYRYERDGFATIQGPRVRLRYEQDNVAIMGSRLTVEGIYQYDKVRGRQAEGMVGFRLPLCKPKCCHYTPTFRRMNDLVERDLGIITRNAIQQTALDQEVVSNIYFFTENGMDVAAGTQSDPTNLSEAIVRAGIGDVLFALNNDGDILLSPTQIELQLGQQLYGFDFQDVVNINFGPGLCLRVEDSNPTGRPNLVQGAFVPVVLAADDTTIFGVELTGGSIGIDMVDVENVLVKKVEVNSPSMTGIRLDNTNYIDIIDSVINTEGSAIETSFAAFTTLYNVNATVTDGTLLNHLDPTGPLCISCSSFANTAAGTGFNMDGGSADADVSVKKSCLDQTAAGGIAASITNTVADIDLCGLDIKNDGSIDTMIIYADMNQGEITFGDVYITNYDNTGSTLTAVSLVNNAGPVRFKNLNVQGEGGVGLLAENNTLISTYAGTFDVAGAAAIATINSDLDMTLCSVKSSMSDVDGLLFSGSTGSFTVRGETEITSPGDQGVNVAQSDMDLCFGSLTICDSVFQGIRWVDSAGSFKVKGETQIKDVQNLAAVSLTGTGVFDFNFGTLVIDNPAGRGISIGPSDPFGSFHADEVVITDSGDAAIFIQGNDDLTLDLTNVTICTSNTDGIFWTDSDGSFTSTGCVTIKDAANDGILVQNSDLVEFAFNKLDIDTTGDDGIHLEDVFGTFTANCVQITDAPAMGLRVIDGDIDVTIGQLNIDFETVMGENGVYLEDADGDFIVTDGGHILFNVPGNNSGVRAIDGSGIVSISGNECEKFEIAFAGLGGDPEIYAGVYTSAINSLTLDRVNIHDIGSGLGSRYGVRADQTVDLLQITNSCISAIDGADTEDDSNGIHIESRPLLSNLVHTMVITDNEIFGAPDFTTTQRGIFAFYGGQNQNRTVDATILRNHLHDLSQGINISIIDRIGQGDEDNFITIEDNLITDLGGLVDPDDNTAISVLTSGFTESIVCILNNIIEADTRGGNNGADYAISLPLHQFNFNGFRQDTTIKGNEINRHSLSNFQQDGIFIDGAGADIGQSTVLIDDNEIRKVNGHGVNLITRSGADNTFTLTNNFSTGDALATSRNASTMNLIFGDPNSPGDNGNDFASQYDLNEVNSSTFRLGSTGGAVTPTQALDNLGNLTDGMTPPVVNTSGTITLVPATPENFPQPIPCP